MGRRSSDDRVDERLVLAVEHGDEPGALIGEPRHEADEVRSAVGDLGTPLFEQRHEFARVGEERFEALGERPSGRGDGAPRPGVAHGAGDPHVRSVVLALPRERREVLHEVEQRVGERRASRNLLLHPRDHAENPAGGLAAAQLPADVVEQPAAAARRERREHDRQLDVARAHRELLARLALGGVRLVDDPVTQRRQDAALRDDVAEQQRVVGDDDVRARGPAAHPVQVAQLREEPAALLGAVGLRGLDRGAQLALAPVQVDRVEVTPARLHRPRVERADRRERVGGRRGRVELAGVALELAQAGVVVVALERDVAKLAAERLVQPGQFVVDELVHERVGLRRHAHAHAVLERVERARHEVGDRLAHAGPGLDRDMRPRVERPEYSARHLELLGA